MLKKKPTNGKDNFYEMEFRNARFYIPGRTTRRTFWINIKERHMYGPWIMHSCDVFPLY